MTGVDEFWVVLECLNQMLAPGNQCCTRCPRGVCVRRRERFKRFCPRTHSDVDGGLIQRLCALSQQGVTPCESRQPMNQPHEPLTSPSTSPLGRENGSDTHYALRPQTLRIIPPIHSIWSLLQGGLGGLLLWNELWKNFSNTTLYH